jgi:hypothetical protein
MAYAMTKERAHALIDGLEPARVPAAVAALELVAAPAGRAKTEIPWEDELISAEEEREAADARAKGYAGDFVSHEELLKDFGMTPEDFERLVLEPSEDAVLSAKRG